MVVVVVRVQTLLKWLSNCRCNAGNGSGDSYDLCCFRAVAPGGTTAVFSCCCTSCYCSFLLPQVLLLLLLLMLLAAVKVVSYWGLQVNISQLGEYESQKILSFPCMTKLIFFILSPLCGHGITSGFFSSYVLLLTVVWTYKTKLRYRIGKALKSTDLERKQMPQELWGLRETWLSTNISEESVFPPIIY